MKRNLAGILAGRAFHVFIVAIAVSLHSGVIAAQIATPRTLFGSEAVQGGLVIGRTTPGADMSFDDRNVPVGADGGFVFGLGRNAPPEIVVRVRHADGVTEAIPLSVRQRDYDIQRIDGLPPHFVAPPPDVLARIENDRALVRNARAEFREFTGYLMKFEWPLVGPITGVYGSQRIYNGEPRRPHFGLDIAAPEGAAVQAPAAGRVTLTHDLYFSGNTVILDHGFGVSTTYIHLSAINVDDGQDVGRGEIIGRVGMTGRATGPHLHMGLNWFGVPLDPQLLLGPRPD